MPVTRTPTPDLGTMELWRNLKVDTVARLQPTPPRGIDADESVSAAVDAMRTDRVGCLLVTRGGRLVGIFTERDLLTRVLAPGLSLSTPTHQCMTADPVTVRPGDSVRTVVKRMEKGGYRHLPVVDEQNRPVGVLSARRVVHYLVEHFPGLVYNLPPDLGRVPELPDGA
jgi:signal-transduction protein with cAMP-binding, CBS, and nucleotidyltransferase domain